MNELISVIVPVYNAQNYLEECLESILNQTYKNIEIICINDGSKDKSLEIIKKYIFLDKRIKLIDKIKNEGVTKARNEGYKICKGDIICNVDSDDFLEKDSIEQAYKFLKEKNLKISLFDSYYFYTEEDIKRINFLSNTSIIDGKKAFIKSLNWEIAPLGLYAKEIIINNFDEIYFNGDELASRKRLLKCDRIGISSGKYFYRQYNTSTTKTKKFNAKKFEILLTDIELKKIIKNQVSEILNEFEVKTLSTLIDFLELYLKNYKNISENDKKEIEKIINLSLKNLNLKALKNYYVYKLKIFKYIRKKIKLKKLLKKINELKN